MTLAGTLMAPGCRPQCPERPANGAIAQLGERVVRNDEVGGSIPPGSTTPFKTTPKATAAGAAGIRLAAARRPIAAFPAVARPGAALCAAAGRAPVASPACCRSLGPPRG